MLLLVLITCFMVNPGLVLSNSINYCLQLLERDIMRMCFLCPYKRNLLMPCANPGILKMKGSCCHKYSLSKGWSVMFIYISTIMNRLYKERLLDEALEASWNMEEDGCPPDEFSYNVINRGFLRHRDDSRAVLEDSMQFRQLLCSYLVCKKAFQLGYEFYAIVCKRSLKKMMIYTSRFDWIDHKSSTCWNFIIKTWSSFHVNYWFFQRYF